MRILRLHIENFGRLKDFSMELSSGLNVLHHENGWGKSTLAVKSLPKDARVKETVYFKEGAIC